MVQRGQLGRCVSKKTQGKSNFMYSFIINYTRSLTGFIGAVNALNAETPYIFSKNVDRSFSKPNN